MNGLGDVEVVVEAVGDRRADAELRVGEHVLHRLGQHVRGGVPDHAAAVLGVGRDRHDLDVGVGRPATGRAAGRRRRAPRRSASGSPRLGSPASRTAAPAVVPAATRIGAAGRGWRRRSSVNLQTVGVFGTGRVSTRPCYRCGPHDPADRALQPGPSMPTSPAAKSSAPKSHSVPTTTAAVNTRAEGLHPQSLRAEPVHHPVVALPGVGQQPARPVELGGQDAPARRTRSPSPGPGYGIAMMPTAEHRRCPTTPTRCGR